MTRWTSEPEAAALALVASALEDLELGDTILQAGGAPLANLLPGRAVVHWNRRVSSAAIVQPEPPPGPYAAAVLRLPKSRDEQLMAAHQCLAVLAPAGRLIVYGGNDEGIRSFHKHLAELGSVVTVAARGHGRILELARSDLSGHLLPRLADWRRHATAGQWVSYPGLFAGGSADPGTALLIGHLPPLPLAAKVLDYGCGPGAIAAAIRIASPGVDLTLIDNDSVALVAAAENVAGARLHLADALTPPTGAFDMIISNPPLHSGFKEDLSALHRLIATAPAHLTAHGKLVLVVQRRIALDHALASSFANVETTADDGRYRVWLAHGRR